MATSSTLLLGEEKESFSEQMGDKQMETRSCWAEEWLRESVHESLHEQMVLHQEATRRQLLSHMEVLAQCE